MNTIQRFILRSCIPALLVLSVLAGTATAEKRTALVIGNSGYTYGALQNPGNDARDMAATLRSVGFSVTLRLDASQQEMEEAIHDFGTRLRSGGIGLFYYSGHGVQVDAVNYLIPVGARIVKESDVRYKAVNIGQVLDEMGEARNGLNIVIMDACRDNPLEKNFRSSTRGLARVKGPRGTLIAYSTEPGSVAYDGDGRNSPYTKHLISSLTAENRPLEQVFKEVLKGVYADTGGKQVPWVSSSFFGDFYFAGKNTDLQPAAVNSAAVEIPRQSTGKTEPQQAKANATAIQPQPAWKNLVMTTDKWFGIKARVNGQISVRDDKIVIRVDRAFFRNNPRYFNKKRGRRRPLDAISFAISQKTEKAWKTTRKSNKQHINRELINKAPYIMKEATFEIDAPKNLDGKWLTLVIHSGNGTMYAHDRAVLK